MWNYAASVTAAHSASESLPAAKSQSRAKTEALSKWKLTPNLCLPKTPSDLKTQKLRSFVYHGRSTTPSGRDSRHSAPTGRSPKERAASPAPQPLRPTVVGAVIAIVVGLKPKPANRSTRRGH